MTPLTFDLRWRNPDRTSSLRRRALDYYKGRLDRLSTPNDEQALEDYLYLHRDHAVFSPFLKEHGRESILPRCEPATIADHQQLLALLERYEGEQSARILAHWLAVQPEGAWVIRGDGGRVTAFMFIVRLDAAGGVDLGEDSITRAIWRFVQERKILGTRGAATIMRFVVDADTYQGISPEIGAFAVALLRHCLTVPNLKIAFTVLANPEMWDRLATSTGFFLRADDFQFEVGGRSVGVFMQDWREESPEMWLARLSPPVPVPEGRRDETIESQEKESLLTAKREQFAKDVRHALKHFHVLDIFTSNALVNAEFVRNACGPGADKETRVEALRRVIYETIEFLGTLPTREKLYRASATRTWSLKEVKNKPLNTWIFLSAHTGATCGPASTP